MLTNRDYLGTQIYGRRTTLERKANGRPGKRVLTPEETWIPVTIPALIDPQTFEKAQNQMAVNKLLAKRNTKHQYLFGAGRVTCGVCRLHMGGTTDTAGRIYYKCNAQRGHVDACRRCLSERKLEQIVWRDVQHYFRDPQVALRLFQQHQPEPHIPHTRDLLAQKATLEKDQRKIATKLQRLEEAYYDGTETREEYADKKKTFQRERDLVATQLLALQAQEQQGQFLTEHHYEMEQVLAVIADKLQALGAAQQPEEQALLKADLLTLLRLTVEYLPNKQIKIHIQPWPALGQNFAVVSRLLARSLPQAPDRR
jgi:hypothetical protein